ncbi:MAG: hypothetical protein ABJC26_02805 [Gemmatimonadaceae bacterium]
MTSRLKLRPIVLLATTAFVAVCVSSCGAGAPVGPDALPPESFELSLVDGQTLPAIAYHTSTGIPIWIASGRIKATVAGRTIDPRIFENRSGQGTSGGSSRDSTTAAAIVSDIRVFYEGDRSGTTGTHTDTSNATIERRGDLLIITRDGPIPRLIMTDTAQIIDGKLVFTAHEWERFSTKANAQFIYSITK